MRMDAVRLLRATADFDGRTATLRPPRLRDAAGWVATRRAEEARLRPAFGVDDGEWRDGQSELAFVERCLRLRRAAARGLAIPGLLTIDGADGPHVLGEVGLDSIDLRTGTGELSAWSGRDPDRARVVRWAMAVLVQHAFAKPSPLRRVVAPQACTGMPPPRSLSVMGFVDEMTFAKHRIHNGRLLDHRLWVLQNTLPARRAARLASLV